ncbi:MAG: SDR family oxidoreductase [Candidatus Aminicenantes bacterium]|nr:SDR family oxidoreductase [Candidatus Aminicenantes bacterium]
MDKKQIMIVTGTRKGLGRFLAHYYAEKKFMVVGCSREPVDFQMGNYRHFCLDVAAEPEVKKMFSEIRQSYDRLDVLINNAGIAAMNYALLTPLKTVQDVFNTNFIGAFLFCREALKLMKKKSFGRIINISSIHVPQGTAGSSIYSASKAALEQFSKVLAREAAPSGVTVNTLGLSFVNDTGMVENLGEEAVSEILQHTILKERLDFEDVGNAVDFFISPKSKRVTAQTLYLG